MWIEKRNNAYRLYERYTDPTGKTHKVSVKIDRDTAQQRNKGKKILDAKIASLSQVVQVNLTFRQLTQFYLHEKRPFLKESTHRRNERECITFNKLFGDVRVENMTAPMIRTQLMEHSKYKPSTYNEHLQRFKEIIKWGYVNDYVEDMSFINKLVSMKDKSKKEKIKDKFLEKEECTALLNGMNHEGRLLCRFMILSGVRVGEALALTTEDIKMDSRVISINKTLDPVTREITPPKTFTSNREVYMQNDLLTLCETIRAEVKKRPSVGRGKPKPLFWNADGRPMEQNAFNKCLRETSERVLGRKITSHVLRHTHASLMAEEGYDYEIIARRLGHENSAITKQIYIHITEGNERKTNNRMKDMKLLPPEGQTA